MLGSISQGGRFNFLYLSEGSQYYESFKAIEIVKKKKLYFEDDEIEEVEGRLYFTSHSLIFDPEKHRHAMVKLKFNKVCVRSKKKKIQASIRAVGKDQISITVDEYIHMKKHNKISLYETVRQKKRFIFLLQHTPRDKFLNKLIPIVNIWHTHKRHFKITEALKKTTQEQENTFIFDITYISDFREKKVFEHSVRGVKPLMEIFGKLVMTNKKIYFQAKYNLGDPIVKINLSKIIRVMKRRYILQHNSIEIFLKEESHYYVFSNTNVRDIFYNELLKYTHDINVKMDDDLREMTSKWQRGELCNFDYILFLNFISDRSFKDLTQYPVFPWVIRDFKMSKIDLKDKKIFRDLCKPIGALNEKRLKMLKKRYNEMIDENKKFLYGTHYSNPYMVLYYLVRQAPEYMLRLQNGKFDNPDRLFHSLQSTWESITTNPTDLKELIPEFYQSTGNFLLNSLNLNLGTRSDGELVNNTYLPKWAKNPKDFIYLNRLALESEHVSKNLHNWIDLIFGYKQRGEHSVKANNVFHWLTYEGAVDLNEIKDPIEKLSYQEQIKEFGQTPKQVLKMPHPKRIVTKPIVPERFDVVCSDKISFKTIFGESKKQRKAKRNSLKMCNKDSFTLDIKSNNTSKEESKDENLKVKTIKVLSIDESFSEDDIDDNNNDDILKDFNNGAEKFLRESDVPISKFFMKYKPKVHRDVIGSIKFDEKGENIFTASHDSTVKIYSVQKKRQVRRLANYGNMALSKCIPIPDTKNVIISSWNNNIYLYNIGFGSMVNILSCHEDAVSSIVLYENRVLSSSWDGSVKMFKLKDDNNSFNEIPSMEYDEHNSDEVQCVCFSSNGKLSASGDRNGHVVVYDLKSDKKMYCSDIHEGAITGIMFYDDKNFLTCSEDKTIKLHRIKFGDISIFKSDCKINCCLCYDNVIVSGNDNGVVEVWDVNNTAKPLFSKKGIDSPITSLDLTSDKKKLVTAHKNGKIALWH